MGGYSSNNGFSFGPWHTRDDAKSGFMETARKAYDQSIVDARAMAGPDAADDAVQSARTFERRKQIGLQGRMSTFLTTGSSGEGEGSYSAPTTTILGS
jgi:hypothetical protein